MNTQELVVLAQESVKKHGEVMVKNVINDVYDPAFEVAKDQVRALIPGTVADEIVVQILSQFAPVLKVALLSQADKMSAQV